MKDAVLLLLAAAGVALLAWGFWHVLGDNGLGIVSTIALLVAVADNIRLRRRLRSKSAA